MKNSFVVFFLLTSFVGFSQNITVDSQTYSAQELIENILVNSNCITNVNVTNVIGGNFGSTDKSYGYFNASGTSFPFENGIVLSTGKLKNVEGPNTTLSDDDATNWNGDTDLETILNETNTTNATIIEFDFVPLTNQVSFNYIFASEEYNQNSTSTCNYSDLFGFLIRPISDSNYTNIALVPNTQTPVKVTTVHPDIPNGCAAQNESYFGSWNNTSAPINFNGQTKALTATATVQPKETYHVKLVIADEENYRFDSAVFLEAGSFQQAINLGEDRLYATNNPVCKNETLELNADEFGVGSSYKWFKNGVQIPSENSHKYTVVDSGFYEVEVTLGANCVSKGEITVEYDTTFDTTQVYLSTCDNDTDGLSFFNLRLADEFFIFDNTYNYTVLNYYLTENNALDDENPIPDPTVFFNTIPDQVLYARIQNDYGCIAVEPLTLGVSHAPISVQTFEACDDDSDGFTTFNLAELRALIRLEALPGNDILFYNSYNDAANSINELPDSYVNSIANTEEIFVKSEDYWCEFFATVKLQVIEKPSLLPNDETTYCLDIFPSTITLDAGLQNPLANGSETFEWFKNGTSISENTSKIEVNETGVYTVKVSFNNNCSAERTITVQASEKATINDIRIIETSSGATIEVMVTGDGDYEYALDGNDFQENSSFFNVSGGSHVVFVNDINNCGVTTKQFSIVDFPKYFTPNNDGFNDLWQPFGSDNTSGDVSIFDRFGKLIIQLNAANNNWDGTFNGNPMPSGDYWYKAKNNSGEITTGHFTLKR